MFPAAVRTSMRSRLPSWVLLIYLAIDLANPFVPGAFRFTPEEGAVWVEGTTPVRGGPSEAPTGAATSISAAPAADSGRRALRARSARAERLIAWLVRVRTGDPSAHDVLPSDSDDH